jgi:hypothetical protein
MLRHRIVGTALLGLAFAAGCGVQPDPSVAPPTSRPARPTAPLVLAQFERGVGAVPVGSDDPQWADPSAVAALDGSAVFSIRHEASGTLLARLDPDTGGIVSSWLVPAGVVSIGAVSPDGRWIALTDREPDYLAKRPRPSTRLVVFDTTAGAETHRLDQRGDLRPEAFSVDGTRLFVLDYRGDSYRVETIILATGERYETASRDKATEREDMYGTAVRGVLSADRTLLATLYRNPSGGDEPAFVHVLDLLHGWAYCADLQAPFGTGPVGRDRIELSPRGTVLVTALRAGRVAEIHIDEVHTPSDRPVTVEYRDGPTGPSPTELGGPSGFGYVIATLG